MQQALRITDPLSISSISSMHDALMKDTQEALGLRTEQVWIGGTPYSLHGAKFVPPHASLVEPCLDDLIDSACEKEILSKIGNVHRGMFYQAHDVIGLLDDVSSIENIRRIVSV